MLHAVEFERLSAAAVTVGIPRHMVQSVVLYSLMGQPVGDFLQAVISGDLFLATQRADYVNKPQLHRFAEFFLLHAPDGCYGSREIYTAWVNRKGLSSSSDASAPAENSG